MNNCVKALTLLLTLGANGAWAEEVTKDIGGGFHLMVSFPDAYHAECHGDTLQLTGAGGVVRGLQAMNQSGLRKMMSVVVISRFPPLIDCASGTLTVVTTEATDTVYIAAGSEVNVIAGE